MSIIKKMYVSPTPMANGFHYLTSSINGALVKGGRVIIVKLTNRLLAC